MKDFIFEQTEDAGINFQRNSELAQRAEATMMMYTGLGHLQKGLNGLYMPKGDTVQVRVRCTFSAIQGALKSDPKHGRSKVSRYMNGDFTLRQRGEFDKVLEGRYGPSHLLICWVDEERPENGIFPTFIAYIIDLKALAPMLPTLKPAVRPNVDGGWLNIIYYADLPPEVIVWHQPFAENANKRMLEMEESMTGQRSFQL